jgi:hypothetical protein
MENHPGAFAGELARQRRANAARGAGDEHHFAGEIGVHMRRENEQNRRNLKLQTPFLIFVLGAARAE